MTRKPARVKTFIPKRMSLVSTAPSDLADIKSGMPSLQMRTLSSPAGVTPLDPTALSRIAPLD